MIDIVGHFGTTFSYATVGANVARALRAASLLGSVWNMDADWHPDHQGLAPPPGPSPLRGSHAIVFAAPFHYMDAYPSVYGREQSAIFVSPNTDRLSTEHATTCAQFGLQIVPSDWCARALQSAGVANSVLTLPLGVSDAYAEGRVFRQAGIHKRLARGAAPHVVHFCSDQYWPGRKGTFELMQAWSLLKERGDLKGAQLTLHVPPSLHREVLFTTRDLHIAESARVVSSGERGSADDPLLDLFDEADLVVAPSRCEGFGMMFLAALVGGVPLLCTYVTGQVDYLSDVGGWLGIPTSPPAPLAGEVGLAPVVEPLPLANALAVALAADARRVMVKDAPRGEEEWGTWTAARQVWADRLAKWARETSTTT